MASDLDDHIENSLRGVAQLRQQVRDLTAENAQLTQDVTQLAAENATLREHLKKTEADRNYHSRWNAELVTQMNNVGMFVHDAMQKAKVGPYRGSGSIDEQVLAAVANSIGVEQVTTPKIPAFLTSEQK